MASQMVIRKEQALLFSISKNNRCKKVICYTILFNFQKCRVTSALQAWTEGIYSGRIILLPNVFSVNTQCLLPFTICK